MSKFVLFTDTNGQWRWTFRADNGEPIAVSSEGYVSKGAAFTGLSLVKANAAAAVVEPGAPTPIPAIVLEPKPAKKKVATRKKRK